jgi:hypothetical protein
LAKSNCQIKSDSGTNEDFAALQSDAKKPSFRTIVSAGKRLDLAL